MLGLNDFICSCPETFFFLPVCDSPTVVRRPGATTGACDDGAREAGERSGHLPPGRHALFSGVFPRQDSRYEGLVVGEKEEVQYFEMCCVLCVILKCSPFAA